MAEGQLVPIQMMFKLLIQAIQKIGSTQIVLIDGFPRNLLNYNSWIAEMARRKTGNEFNAELLAVLYFELSEQLMIDRILNRAKTSGRIDDNILTAHKRIQTFNQDTLPVVDIFVQNGLLVKIDASKTIEEVYVETRQKLSAKVPFGNSI